MEVGMKNAGIDAINDSILYIESRLPENPDMDELAGRAFFSKTHYQRLFQAIVGEPVMEYIKRRRLLQACQALCRTKSTVLEIALRHGYESQEGFARAFKAHYGMNPTRYRKKFASGPHANQKNREEYMLILSSEVTENIARHARTIAKSLTQSKDEIDKLCRFAEKTAAEAGVSGSTVTILAGELRNLAAKTECAIESVQDFIGAGQTVYDLSGKIYALIKNIDDIAFQTNLLRFLSGIEIARTGINAFMAIQESFAGASDCMRKNHTVAVSLLNDLTALLSADIRKESAGCMAKAAELIDQAAREGIGLANRTREAAIGLSPRGAGFARIAVELEKRAAGVSEVAAAINRFIAEMTDIDTALFPFVDRTAVRGKLDSLANAAFYMNVTAFNAEIETARSGYNEAVSGCGERIVAYAGRLHKTYASCSELFGESERLSGLLIKGGDERPDSAYKKYSKMVDDVIFQGSILAMQLDLESERLGLDVFKRHAKDAIDAAERLSAVRSGGVAAARSGDIAAARSGHIAAARAALSAYTRDISALAAGCGADAEANMPYGGPFAFIAREFEAFAGMYAAIA
jgi:AraC-like DNA-binding protein